MDSETIKIILTLFGFSFAFYAILFAWLFYRTNSNHQKSEAVRLETSQHTESVRVEYMEKIKDLYEENKKDRHQHNQDMLLMQKQIHESVSLIGDKIASQIEKLNVMPEENVKEYVNNKLDPIIEGQKEVKKSNNELVKSVTLLIDRSK